MSTCGSHISFTETEILKPTTRMCAIMFQINYWLNPKWYKSVLKPTESSSYLNWHKTTALFKHQNISRPQSCYLWETGQVSLALGGLFARVIQRHKAWVGGFREVGCTKPVDLVQQTFIYSTVVAHMHSLKYKPGLHEAGMFPKAFGKNDRHAAVGV